LTERALPPGSVRRRAFFGVFDADGWTWAGVKALGWFALMILLLGYIPDRAYYFTVFPTIDVGFNVVSPINLCDPANGSLPCPAPKGAMIPWQGSPAELSLPEGRTDAAAFTAGTSLYLVGGAGPAGTTASVEATQVTADGNLSAWSNAAALPAARRNSAAVALSGTTYVIGGADDSGAPSDTVWEAQLDNGNLTGWKAHDELKLPKPLTGVAAVAGATSIWLFGGQTTGGAYSAAVYRASVDASVNPPKLGAWQEVVALPMPQPRAFASGLATSGAIYVIGGEDDNGPQGSVFRLDLDVKGDPAISGPGAYRGWAISPAGQALPRPRSDAAGFAANGALYVIGGRDDTGQSTGSVYWAIPDAHGDLPGGWTSMRETNLLQARTGSAMAVASGHAFVVGGQGDGGPSVATFRADLAPRPPFFALGLFGATIPALSIKGEIGQQLGYLAAGLVGAASFTLLILVGIAMSHRSATRRLLWRITRGRIREPREDEYSR